jgi:hypothetical protein
MSRGHAESWHAYACMQRGKGMDWVVEVMDRIATRNGLLSLQVLCHFIFVMIVLFFHFVNSLFYVGRVHLLTVSFSLWFGLFVCLNRTCLLFKQPMLSLKDKKNLHSTCGTFLPKEKTNFISLLHFAFGIYYWYQCLVSKWELTKSVLSTWNLNLV